MENMKKNYLRGKRFVFLEQWVETSAQYEGDFRNLVQFELDEASYMLIDKGQEEDSFVEKTLAVAREKKQILLEQFKEDSGLKEKAECNINAAIHLLEMYLRQLINTTREKIEKEQAEVARLMFIDHLSGKISDSEGIAPQFHSFLKGLLGDSRDTDEWDKLYNEHLGWSENKLKTLTKHEFLSKIGVQTEDESDMKEEIQKKPEISNFLSGLTKRAELLYPEKKDFLELYSYYLTFSLNSFKDHPEDFTLANIENIVRTPENYYERGFLNFPPRPKEALKGSEFFEKILGIDLEEFKKDPRQKGKITGVERSNLLAAEIALGNIPSFLRHPKKVTVFGENGSRIETFVMPDYLAIGSDEDFVYVPISPVLAKALADFYGLSLPTKTMVEATYEQATVKLSAIGYTNDQNMKEFSPYLNSSGFYLQHSLDIQKQRALHPDQPRDSLTAGPKKELVISTLSTRKGDNSIHFYGFYDENGSPYQREPGHGNEGGYDHTEYALGIRYVSPMSVVIDPHGQKKVMGINIVQQDTKLAGILNKTERKLVTEDRNQKMVEAGRNISEGAFDSNKSYTQNVAGLVDVPKAPYAIFKD